MRRTALAALTTVALVAGAPTAAADPGDPTPDRDCLVDLHGVDLQRATIPELQQAMRKGRFTSAELVQRYLARIDSFRTYNAVRAVHPEAVSVARQLDRERAAGEVRGPLHGIPVLLKDNVGTKDLPTTAGSIAMAAWRPAQDAVLTARLREAGAIVLGKLNLSEWANWMSTTGMPNGFSSLGGQVRNAFTGGDPSGSSAGSGVAASLALAAATIGTETSGSILSPSMQNSVVGLKTTRGIVSRTGIIPLAEGFDVPGPMVRNVTDAAVVLSAIAGHDPDDAATDAIPASIEAGHDFTAALDEDALRGVRLAYDRESLPSEASEAGELVHAAIRALEDAGAVLVDTSGLRTDGTAAVGPQLAAIYQQFHTNLDRYLQTTPRADAGFQPGSLADVVAYGAVNADRLPYGQDKLVTSLATPANQTAADALTDQVSGPAHAAIQATLDAADAVGYVAANAPNIALGARAGHPTLFVPLGRPGGSRIGIGVLGRRFAEEQLLAAGAAVERAVGPGNRVLPTAVEGGATPSACG